MIQIRPACELPHGIGHEISRVFVDGFGEYFTYFSKDPDVLAAAFAHMFVLDVFYVALIEKKVAGIAACTDGTQYSVQPRLDDLRRHLGFIKGTFAYRALTSEFMGPLPELGPRTASIEFVATGSAHRRKGVAMALIEHIKGLPQYDTFLILEVADNNEGALHLYEKAGFEEYERVRQSRWRAKVSGFDALVSMRYCSPQSGA